MLISVVFRPTYWHWSYNNWNCRLYECYHPVRHQSPIFSVRFLLKIKFSSIKQDSNIWNIKLIFATHYHSMKMHIWKILNINANICVPSWVPRCAGISTKIHQCWFQSRNFYLWNLQKKSKYPITFKFVFITNGAQLNAEECWFLPYLCQHLTSQHWSYHNQKCRLSKIYSPETPVPSFILVLFKFKFSIIIKQESNTWTIKLVCLFITIQWKCIYGKSWKKNANVCVPCWVPRCAGISTKIHQCWCQSRTFNLCNLEKNQNPHNI